jgi:prepilin-type N-terminal cleavage/methylation domain-containing protein
MNRDAQARKSTAGFSMVELLIVAAIGLVLTTIALPNMVVAIADVRLHSSMTTFSGILQNTRMMAVKENRTMTTHVMTRPDGLMAYVKLATDSSALDSSDPQVQLPAPISQVVTPTGPGAPTALDSTILGFTPNTGDPSYNPRGLPCEYVSGTCLNKGFLFYFVDSRTSGNNAWSAISISPAGRIKKWFWSGSSWNE